MGVFKLEIGDWIGNGHGHHESFTVEADDTVETVWAAFAKARELHPGLDPTTFMCEDGSIPRGVWAGALALGHNIFGPDVWPQDLAEYTLWFITLGNPDLRLKIVSTPRLTADLIGYGLFERLDAGRQAADEYDRKVAAAHVHELRPLGGKFTGLGCRACDWRLAQRLCVLPPRGWWCSRPAGHAGPCAARPS